MNTKNKAEERMKRIVRAIGTKALPRCELIADLGLRQESRRNFYTNYLHPAIGLGYVRLTRPDSPSSPEQAYKLSKMGLAYLEEISEEEDSKKEQATEEEFKKGTG